eukprot:2602406-Pyramimonas_sp.AAC.1
MEEIIANDFGHALVHLKTFLGAVGLSKFLGSDSETLVDPKNIDTYAELTDDGITSMISPILEVPQRLVDPVLLRQATFFDKL